MIWFTSDTHFGHENIIKYCNRPFRGKEEMDETLIKNWNSVVSNQDTVYHLGDFAWGNGKFWRDRREALNGNIRLIRGNHDKQIPAGIFDWVKDYEEVDHGGLRIVLFHYPLRSWHHNMRGVGHLYGHCHGGIPEQGKSFDIGVDCWNFFPLSIDEVAQQFEKREAKWLEKGFVGHPSDSEPNKTFSHQKAPYEVCATLDASNSTAEVK